MKKYIAIFCALFALDSCASKPQSHIPIDDSYTVSRRFDGYKNKFEKISWPASKFNQDQTVLFDRQYKIIDNRELHIDVFLPVQATNKRQAILLVHGGAWRSGSKSHFYGLANLLAQKGYVVLLPEYRLSPEAKYPAGLIDINDAIIWAKSQSMDFSFDAEKIAIGGASSGGQMAALLAYSSNTALFKTQGANTKVNALIDLDGVLDFTTPMALSFENAAGVNSVAAKWLGGSWEQIPDRWRQASSTKYLDANSPPTLIISSGLVRFTVGKEEVFEKLNRFGIKNSYYEFSNAPHDIWLFEPYMSQIALKIDEFLSPASKAQ